jgi:hypothetical protein
LNRPSLTHSPHGRHLETTGVNAKIPAVNYVKTTTPQEFNVRLIHSGHIVTEKTIPSRSFSGMWYLSGGPDGEKWVPLLNWDTKMMIVNKTCSSRYQAKRSKIAKIADSV